MQKWQSSQAHDWLTRELVSLKGDRKVTKLLCFGLGDMALMAESEKTREVQIVKMCQHAVAATLAEAFSPLSPDKFEAFAQDPAYSKTSKELLEAYDIQVIGEHGAGGFALIDDESIVYCRYPKVPMSQIIADLARPAIIIRPTMPGQLIGMLQS
ncbi:uncharacterized protein GGS25DRAFT_487064 [Hypoxylon fragiforme]|uniref:uncharacterized protein n=1 Tax=Hypoxylon fragiforme TaxID=63214 RepID=UPI0020C6ECEA|nr:uncharacterized protein GGS25DRAFT_487064 [Hypoxylon fragiforme]KAI2610000.1 hypothetical protein GGS25DRAFT_487064 [Hypoxylon fragiforme]